MKCKQAQQKLVEYSEHVLNKNAQSQIQQHVQTCAACAQELQEIEETVTLLKSVSLQEPSETFWTDFTSNVMKKVSTAEIPVRHRRFFQFPRLTFAVVLCALFVILVGGYAYFRIHTTRVETTAELPVSEPAGAVVLEETQNDETLPLTPDKAGLRHIASDELTQDILESGLALFDGATSTSLDMLSSDDMLDVLLYGLTVEEKQVLLSELYKMKEMSQ